MLRIKYVRLYLISFLLMSSNISINFVYSKQLNNTFEIIGILDDYPLILNLDVVTRLVDAAQNVNQQMNNDEFDISEERKRVVIRQLLRQVNYCLYNKYEIVLLSDDDKELLSKRFNLDDRKEIRNLSTIRFCLDQYINEGKSIDTLYQDYCSPNNISKNELNFYISIASSLDNPEEFADNFSMTNDVELIKWSLFQDKSKLIQAKNDLMEILLSEEQKNSMLKLMWFEVELLEYLRDNLEISNPEYEWLKPFLTDHINSLQAKL